MTALATLTGLGKVEEGAPLAALTTYKLGGPARYLVEADGEDEVLLASHLAGEAGLPLLPLGRGSNLVVADSGFAGVVVRPGPGLSTRVVGTDGVVTAGSGASLPVLAREAARAGRGGLEFFTGIPGSVGGAVRMNAGCHGSDTSEWLLTARVVGFASGLASERAPADLDMGYRHTNLSDGEMVVSARFRTVPVDPARAEARIREITRWRRQHQPGGTLNAGSVFKNPPGDSAGRIIDQVGLKGFRVGGAEVSRRHANFFIAGDGATAQDVFDLVAEVRRRVHDATGIELVPELRFVGEFR